MADNHRKPKNDPTRVVWAHMVSRCTNLKHVRYAHYRSRGISVCERWMEFSNFLEDMGKRPSGTSIDRIDNSKGYSKDNCRWAAPSQQSRNQSRNRMLTYNGETKCLADWADEVGIEHWNIRTRLREGWSVERALTEPVKKMKPRKPEYE